MTTDAPGLSAMSVERAPSLAPEICNSAASQTDPAASLNQLDSTTDRRATAKSALAPFALRSQDGDSASIRASNRQSRTIQNLTDDELQDLRAVQRTFDGAYMRTALGELVFALVILRLFQTRFYYVGVAYTTLALIFVGAAAYRFNLALQNEKCDNVEMGSSSFSQFAGAGCPRAETTSNARDVSDPSSSTATITPARPAMEDRFPPTPSLERSQSFAGLQIPDQTAGGSRTVNAARTRGDAPLVLSPIFRTAGGVVAFVTVLVLAIYVALFSLILDMS
ncbi:hypothetical protein IE81DRAFT_350317 [Ceraceosorus guamensis]|uniref:DUF202 domain-containing protein n=1 Tax=Ceraceosorus guamensis TaxID=1522189 RepID=A0A316VPL9_9BASI|nr:hypothetical protein IE81DRAFT_350317 [Ceraceosorus guamensis]PWN39280.1 hypothetical protein IE81DRAFT_350317 [Ceraceosorus guamensis]